MRVIHTRLPWLASPAPVLAAVSLLLAGCAGRSSGPTPAQPAAADWSKDARVGLSAGLSNAAEATSYMKVTGRASLPAAMNGQWNSDITFLGKYAIQGNFGGLVIWDISDATKPTLVTTYPCPASQNDVSVYRNMLFMSVEANNGRIDCAGGGVRDTVSAERMRGVRIFDITDIRAPKLVANVQTCRGSHTHTVLEDPKDKANVYIYVSGSADIRSPREVAGCAGDVASNDPNSSRLRIEIIKVPLNDPSKAAVVSRANIFAGLTESKSHGPSDADKAASSKMLDAARAQGAFIAKNPQSGMDMVVPGGVVRPMLDSIAKARGGTSVTAADSASLRGVIQVALNRMFERFAGNSDGNVSERSQCHDITVYPALGLAGGACEGHGILLDISNPVNPVRLDAAADSNFAYWHSATFNNDGTKILFSDEWGGGTQPKCRAGDKPEWGSNAIFSIVDRKMKFEGYYKIPTVQSSTENCVAHNGSLIPIPGRDVMIQAWYQGGISAFDFTDPARPFEIASFDRGPIDSTRMVTGGSWSVYWYNGQMISSEIARGIDVAELTPSPFVSQNEIDAAKTVTFTYFNAQGQPQLRWPPTFALARAYTDQLERKGCLARGRISAIRSSLSAAEKATGTDRTTALRQLMGGLDADARSGCDDNKVKMLQKAVQDLQGSIS
jgi:hypothetical protein